MSFSPDGHNLAISYEQWSTVDSRVAICDTSDTRSMTLMPESTLMEREEILTLAFSHDGKRLAAIVGHKIPNVSPAPVEIRLWNAKTKALDERIDIATLNLAKFSGFQYENIRQGPSLEFSPSGTCVRVASGTLNIKPQPSSRLASKTSDWQVPFTISKGASGEFWVGRGKEWIRLHKSISLDVVAMRGSKIVVDLGSGRLMMVDFLGLG